MAEETDRKLDERLKDIGYEADKSNPNEYSRPNENGGHDRLKTDGDYYQEHDSVIWKKYYS